MIIILVQVLLAGYISTSVGDHRRIGIFWSFFFCVTLSIVIGLLITLASPKKTNPDAYDNRFYAWTLLLAIPIGLLGLYLAYSVLNKPGRDFYTDEILLRPILLILPIAIGWVGLAIYYPNPPKLQLPQDNEAA